MTENKDGHTFKVLSLKAKVIIVLLIILFISGSVECSIFRQNQYNKYLNLANTSMKNENFDEAINYYELAGKYRMTYDSNKDIQNVKDISDSKSNYDTGIKDFNNKDYVSALSEFRKVIATDSKRYNDALKKIDLCKSEGVKNYYQLAKETMQQQDYNKAIGYLNLALEIQPKNQEVSQLKSQCNEINAKIKADADAKAKAEQEALEAKAKAEQEAKDAQALAEQKAQAKTQGVRIGMTQQQVLDSMWGKPEQINRTTTAFGVSEQWVYGMNSSKMNFLYFENGILTDIQN